MDIMPITANVSSQNDIVHVTMEDERAVQFMVELIISTFAFFGMQYHPKVTLVTKLTNLWD